MRVARSVKAYGKEYGKYQVGKFLDVTESIDGKKIEGEDKEKFQLILDLFNRAHELDPTGVLAKYKVSKEIGQKTYYGLTDDQRNKLVQEAISASSVGDDNRHIEEIVGQYRPKPGVDGEATTTVIEPEVTPKAPIIDKEILGEVKRP